LRVTFLGSGDAFGSGGRLQACFLVDADGTRFLIDCGASSLVGMRGFGIAPNEIGLILLSHLHGDHFGGLPFFILDAQFVSRRTEPLVIAGPPTTGERLRRAMEVMFPGSADAERTFAIDVVELEAERSQQLQGVSVTAFTVRHPSGAPAFALRVEAAGKVIAYSGDTEWTESLIPAARGSDLLIAEAYFYEKRVPAHLDFRTLSDHLDQLETKRLIITHMSEDMLARAGGVDCETAADGKVIEL
jgi:ribonuclease BN (tRNA processing enzyme)